MKTRHIHHNRIKEVINNPKNKVKHIKPILQMIENFRKEFKNKTLHSSLVVALEERFQ